MLKALQLAGFKSFADKTLFEFDEGITVVVGPNGSGKSNVVDAIKWVLGEQSVKSLRGKEMADVIFNGSASRHPLNAAEATLIFDNTRRSLPLEEDEVRLTRRVYRGGEGEYLINDQAVRRRDIRELVAGAASGAYSIIEQGKVDGLLQASPRERRLIFEEAAGVSRFRLKKVETQRRLERVELNLQRLKDIVDEVESRLRTIRNQAKRARQYQEYKSRLQELRTQAALVDWRHWSARLDELDTRHATLSSQTSTAATELTQAESEQARWREEQATADEASRQATAQASALREELVREQASAESQRRRIEDFARRIDEQRLALAGIRARSSDLNQTRLALVRQLQAARSGLQNNRQATAEFERQLRELKSQLEELRTQNEERREAYLGHIRDQSVLQREMTTAESALTADGQSRDRQQARVAALEERSAQLTSELEAAGMAKRTAAEAADSSTRTVFQRKSALAAARNAASEVSDRRHEISAMLSRQRERADVLEELEERKEGIEAGAQFALAQAATGQGPFANVLGLVAELLHVNVDVAPLVEVALGDRVGDVVVATADEFLAELAAEQLALPGRLGIVAIDRCQPASRIDFDLRGGVIGRADRFVECSEQLRPLAEDLLGDAWIVESLDVAAELLAELVETGQSLVRPLRFITLDGESLSTDGRITLGGHPQIAGPMSRRSELRALAEKIQLLEVDVAQVTAEEATARQNLIAAETSLDAAILTQREAEASLADSSRREELHSLHLAEAAEELTQARREVERVLARMERTRAGLAEQEQLFARLEAELAAREREIAGAAKEIIQLDAARKTLESETTAAQVALAKSEERVANLEAQVRQLEVDQQERGAGLRETEMRLEQAESQRTAAELAVLAAESRAAELYLRKDQFAGAEVRQKELLATSRQALEQINARVNSLRDAVRRNEAEMHSLELAAGELRGKRDALATRMKDEYAIDLEQYARELLQRESAARQVTSGEGTSTGLRIADPDADAGETEDAEHAVVDHAAVEREIEMLRDKLARLGNVNLEALDELQGLEDRYTELSTQYADLSQARTQLAKIIEKINGESRRLFTDTLTNVREHFRSLFRKLFGGGQADIVMEENADPLEAGVEIVAQPPGKELRSISLLSGGEKTLTCVALLMSLFRNRPSPFCVLDEVDAALDEANIERFTSVLREFLEITQFIVVTHSKKTMTCANTLYGVTMQESGISKRVSVRFEDVTEDGRIMKPADDQAA